VPIGKKACGILTSVTEYPVSTVFGVKIFIEQFHRRQHRKDTKQAPAKMTPIEIAASAKCRGLAQKTGDGARKEEKSISYQP